MPLVEKKLLEFGGKKCVLRKEIEHRHLDVGFRAAQEKSPFFFKKKEESKQLKRSIILNSHAMGPR